MENLTKDRSDSVNDELSCWTLRRTAVLLGSAKREWMYRWDENFIGSLLEPPPVDNELLSPHRILILLISLLSYFSSSSSANLQTNATSSVSDDVDAGVTGALWLMGYPGVLGHCT
ncbi:hypothetical protein SCHPADRAFT_729434 [Schizopora paradoxa]|uniref:Uncharacterized protein n=1 Tax=Schizopora paradoxa TaxID=27342 RepID=A0A0H2R0W8_9AGAM|nr:hypothetical protein SCHPADRAFT_729434 [Schizopora paradoxa]